MSFFRKLSRSYALYRGHRSPLTLLINLFLECMHLATEGVEFSFNDIVYADVDGLSMGSPLCPVLALCIFSVFDCMEEIEAFPFQLNFLTRPFSLLWGWRVILLYPFWICWLNGMTGVVHGRFFYRKPTFTAVYTHWNTFVPKSQKLNQIPTLAHRALMACSPCRLHREMANIYSTFRDKSYLENVAMRVVNARANVRLEGLGLR